MSQSLTSKVIKGGFWISALKIFSKALSLVRTVVLARLLLPEDFGIMGVIILSISFLYMFSQTGMGMALVQKKKNVDDYLDTSWIVAIVRGIIIFLILFFGSTLLAKFFDNPGVAFYLKIAAFSPLVLAFSSPKLVYLEKKLEFEKRFIIDFSATFVDIFVSIGFALVFRNAWALVFGLLAGDIVRLLTSYYCYPYVPRFKFEYKKALELFHFGKWIFINGILLFAISRGADIMVGKLLGLAALGLYQMAYKLTNLISSEIHHVFYQVTFPAYARIQDDKERLKNAFLRVIQIVGILSLPVTVLIIFYSADFTHLFLGEKWFPMIPAMKILAFIALFSSLSSSVGPLFMSLGRPDIPSKLQAVNLLVLAAVLYPLTMKYNITGTAVAALITHSALVPVRLYLLLKLINCRPIDFFRQFRISIISGLVMTAVIYFSKLFLFQEGQLFHFILGVGLACASYLAALIVFDRHYKLGFGRALHPQAIKVFFLGFFNVKNSSDSSGE